MSYKHFKREKLSIKDRFIERRKLLRPFINKYKRPVLVHAIDKKEVFKKVLEEGKLKLPNSHSSPKKTPFMEKILRIDNGIYYSLGFVYLTAYDWKYNLIFDVNSLKGMIYYKNSVNYQCYKAVIDYWYKNNKDYLEKLANTNELCRRVVDKYYNEEYKGKKRMLFDFWKIEKYVFKFIQNYPNKKEIYSFIKRVENKFTKKFPASLNDAKISYLTERTPEIIGLNEVNLFKNKNFLGFYIDKEINKDIMSILKKKYPDKIIFNGIKIVKISDID